MKKKLLLGSFILVAACCGLSACSLSPSGNGSGEYAALNEMLKAHYSEIELTIGTDFGEDTLESTYIITYGEVLTTVTYSVEEFALFEIAHPDAGGKIVKEGKATIAGENIIVDEGEDIGLSAAIAQLPFDFREDYFDNAELTGVYLNADVKNAAAFTGSALTCTNMKVWAEFLDHFRTIKLTYTDGDGNAVSVQYTFSL